MKTTAQELRFIIQSATTLLHEIERMRPQDKENLPFLSINLGIMVQNLAEQPPICEEMLEITPKDEYLIQELPEKLELWTKTTQMYGELR